MSLSQPSAVRGRERTRAETLRKKLDDEGWQLHDPKEHSLVLPHFSRDNLYIRLICDTPKDNIDIFLHFLSQDLLQTIWNGQIEDDPNVWEYDHSEGEKKTVNSNEFKFKTILKFLAIKVRIQGLQIPQKGLKSEHTLRANIHEAKDHFEQLIENAEFPGHKILSRLISRFLFVMSNYHKNSSA